MILIWILIAFAVLLLIASVPAILMTKDAVRKWDHLARSTVQMAVALASVALALFLLKKQFDAQDSRIVNQQVSSTEASLRLLTVALHADIASSQVWHHAAVDYACTVEDRSCALNSAEAAALAVQRQIISEWIDDDPPRLILRRDDYTADIAQIVRGNPILGESAVRHLMAAASNFELATLQYRYAYKRLRADYRRTEQRVGETPKVAAIYVSLIARTQALTVHATAQLMCQLDGVSKAMREPHFLEKGKPLEMPDTSFVRAADLCNHPMFGPEVMRFLSWNQLPISMKEGDPKPVIDPLPIPYPEIGKPMRAP